jgi:hypothetical protein
MRSQRDRTQHLEVVLGAFALGVGLHFGSTGIQDLRRGLWRSPSSARRWLWTLDRPAAVGWFFDRIAEKGFPLAAEMRT